MEAVVAPPFALAFDATGATPSLVPVAVAVPELAPPAASTVVTVPLVVLPPIWPVALALPLVLVAVPLLVTLLVLLNVATRPAVAPSLAPPDTSPPGAEFVMSVVTERMPSPLASPVLAVALSAFQLRTVWEFVAVVSPPLALALPPPEAEAVPEFAPPAASTVVTVPVVELLPF